MNRSFSQQQLYSLSGAGLAGVAALVVIFASGRETPAVSAAVEPVMAPAPVIAPRETNVYETGSLKGRRAGDLYRAFLGYEGDRIPARLSVDWLARLDYLWARKASRRDSGPVVHRARAMLVNEYRTRDPGRISLESYQEIAGNQARAVCAELDWEQVRRRSGLDERKGALLKRISCNMGGRVILAYAMAELLPSTDGELNRDYLDFMLRHAGRRYVESLPALHDSITSFGPLQFTHFAVYDNGRERRGASRVNLALPERLRIPGSTLYLRDSDHLRAAYLFGVSNLADVIRSMNARQVATFERVGGPRGVDVAQFLATAHNKPAVARRAMRAWLDSGARRSYREFCPRVSRLYATKTYNNYRALAPTRS